MKYYLLPARPKIPRMKRICIEITLNRCDSDDLTQIYVKSHAPLCVEVKAAFTHKTARKDKR